MNLNGDGDRHLETRTTEGYLVRVCANPALCPPHIVARLSHNFSCMFSFLVSTDLDLAIAVRARHVLLLAGFESGRTCPMPGAVAVSGFCTMAACLQTHCGTTTEPAT